MKAAARAWTSMVMLVALAAISAGGGGCGGVMKRLARASAISLIDDAREDDTVLVRRT